MSQTAGTTAVQGTAQPQEGGQGPAPVAPQPAGTADPQSAAAQGDPSDESRWPEQARATLAKLREFEKQAKSQAKELETLKAQQRQREEAELSEQEKLARRAERAEQEAASLKQHVAALSFRTAVIEAAQPMGFVDLDAVVKLLDPSEVQRQDDGTPDSRSLKAALERLKTQRSWLAAPTQPQAPAAPQFRPLPGTPPAARPAPTDLVAQEEQRLRASGRYRPF